MLLASSLKPDGDRALSVVEREDGLRREHLDACELALNGLDGDLLRADPLDDIPWDEIHQPPRGASGEGDVDRLFASSTHGDAQLRGLACSGRRRTEKVPDPRIRTSTHALSVSRERC